jgi:hypothetical protein
MNKGPRGRRPRSLEGQQAPINLTETQVSFDREAFEHALRTHGVLFEHHRAILDPTGMASKGDNHAVLTGHVRTNSDGFLYEKAGCLRGLFLSNSMSGDQHPEGYIQFSTAYLTLPSRYEGSSEPLLVAPYDRLYMKDIETRVICNQYVEASMTGLDKLQYPATCIEHVVDANGVRYKEGVDFELTVDGNIRWIGASRPGFNVKVGRGTVYSVRYRYTAFFVVARHLHEIRVANISDLMTDERTLERMPYQVQVVRENVFYDQNIDPNRPVPPQDRFVNAPSPGGLLGPDPSGKLGP